MGVVALYYRVSGILLDRTTGVGEILIASGDQIEANKIADPACTSYNISDLMQKVISQGLDCMTIFCTFIGISMTM